MKKSTPILLSVTTLLIISLACALPSVPAPTQDIHSLETAVMGTMVSGSTQTAISGAPVGLIDTATPLATFTPESPNRRATWTNGRQSSCAGGASMAMRLGRPGWLTRK